MKAKLKEWAKADYHFNLDWLLRSVNTVLTGEAKFQYLHEKSAEEVQDGLKRANKYVDTSLNLIGGRLGTRSRPSILWALWRAGHGAVPGPTAGPQARSDG